LVAKRKASGSFFSFHSFFPAILIELPGFGKEDKLDAGQLFSASALFPVLFFSSFWHTSLSPRCQRINKNLTLFGFSFFFPISFPFSSLPFPPWILLKISWRPTTLSAMRLLMNGVDITDQYEIIKHKVLPFFFFVSDFCCEAAALCLFSAAKQQLFAFCLTTDFDWSSDGGE